LIRAFAYVTVRSFWNRIAHRLKRLRQPRYLLSVVVAIAYFYFGFFHGKRPGRNFPPELLPFVGDLVSIVVLMLLLFVWIGPTHSALEFSAAEMHFLFSGPVKRWQILLYKLFRAQPAILTTVIVLAFFRIPNGHVLGIWVAFTALSTYTTFVQLARARLREAGIGSLAVGIATMLVACTVGWFLFSGIGNFHRESETSPFATPARQAILRVPSTFVSAASAKELPQAAGATAILAVAAAALLFLGSRFNVPFEEVVMHASETRAKRRQRLQGGRMATTVSLRGMPPLFRLRDGTSAEAAILWKNVVATMRIALPWIVLTLVAYSVILAFGLFGSEEVLTMCFGMSLFLVFWFPFTGSAIFQQDLRLDFRQFDILKGWPVSGERLIAATMAAPLVVISTIELVFVLGTFGLAQRLQMNDRFFSTPESMVIALLFAIPVCAAQLSIKNAVPVLFPSWAGKSKEEQRGFMAFGQRLLTFILNLVLLGVFLLAPLIVSGAGIWVAKRFAGGGPLLLALATMPAAALLSAEVWMAVKFLGSQFESLDVSTEMDPTGAA
jgi:hypothetical protein